MRLTHRHVFAVVTLSLSACSGTDSTPPATTGPGDETRLILTLSAQTDTIPEATSKLLTARVTDRAGFVKSATVTWRSTDANIASVNNGLVTGISLGVASIIASTTGAADTASILVTENGITLDVQPSAAAVAMGDTVNFVATMRSRSGDIVQVNSFSWTASDTVAASFIGAGRLRTKREGELQVSAQALAREGNSTVKIFRSPVASVTIAPGTVNIYRGASTDLVVTLRDRNGRLVEGAVTWGSSDYSRATVSSTGHVTGVGVGTVVITATAEGKTGSATVSVMSPPAVAVALTLPSEELLVGAEMQATATPVDSAGQPLSGKTIAYQSANPSIATVTSTGKVKGIAEGSVMVRAIVDGVIASEDLSVKGAKAASIAVSPANPSVGVGQQLQLTAQVLDQAGAAITGQTITWSSSNTSFATVSASGLVSGIAAGSAVITASSGALSKSISATVTATTVLVASVRVSPTSTSLVSGRQTTVSAEAVDASGNVLAGRVVTWSSQNPTVATVTNTGLVTAVSVGSTTLTATIEGKSASISVTVSAAPLAPVANVSVSLASASLSPGQQTQATVILTDGSGNTLTGRAINWYSLDTAVAKVNSNGLVTAYNGGTVAIMASSEGKSGSASLTVATPTAAPVARVEIVVPTQNLDVGESVQSVVTLYDAAGNVLTGRTVTYASDNSSILTVSASGVLKGMSGGTTKMKVSSGGVTAQETFYVTATSTVASIVVAPSSSSLAVGQTTQATAVAKDAQGVTMSGTTFTWTTSNAGVATVSGSGLVTAVGTGSATIHAAASGVTGSMAVNVTTSAPSTSVVASVTVSLSSPSILIGGTSQATAVARNSSGSVITGKTATWSLGGSQVASVTSSGLVTGLVAGTVSVIATIDGVSGSASLTISAPLAPPPVSTTVALPRTYLNYSYPAKTGQTILVPPGANLQTALNNAQRGDEIVLTAGATYTGNFVLPAKSGTSANGWIVIRSDQSGQLPALGTRVTPSYASLMAKIVTSTVSPAIKTSGAASGWWLTGIEVTVSPSLTAQQYGIVTLGESGSPQTTLAAVPHDLVLDRMYIHGQTTTNVSRCVALNSGRTQITDSYLAECHGKDFDAQAIAGWNGPGPYKIVNNMLMGAAENVIFGGADPAIPNLVPSDIEIRRNHVYTPIAWKGIWLKKNLLELKNATRVLIEENVFDGSWTHGQTGWALVLMATNQSGNCRWCSTSDITIRRNLIKNAGAGINLIPRFNSDSVTSRVLISENVLDNIGVSPYDGDRRGFQLLTQVRSATLERNVLGAGNLAAALITEGGATCTFKDNVLHAGTYGVFAGGAGIGTPALTLGCGTSYTWSGMTFIGSSGGNPYPSGTTWVSGEQLAPLAAQIRGTVSSATGKVIQGLP